MYLFCVKEKGEHALYGLFKYTANPKALFASLIANRSCKSWGNLGPDQISPLCVEFVRSSLGKWSLCWPLPLCLRNTSHQPAEEHRGACSRASNSPSLAHSGLLQGYSPPRPRPLSPASLPSHPPVPAITEPLTSTQTIIPLP